MTLEISLAPEQEARLRERAAAEGKDVQTYAREALIQTLDRPTLSELLAPIQEGFRRSGLSEEELDETIEQARNEVWRERQGRR